MPEDVTRLTLVHAATAEIRLITNTDVQTDGQTALYIVDNNVMLCYLIASLTEVTSSSAHKHTHTLTIAHTCTHAHTHIVPELEIGHFSHYMWEHHQWSPLEMYRRA